MIVAKSSNWVASALSLIILLLRLAISRRTPHPSRLGDALVVISIFIITVRIPVISYALHYGTAADVLDDSSTTTKSPHEIKIGSILTLIARFLATTFYWTQTALLLTFYTHVLSHISWCQKAIKVIWATIILTYIVCTLSVFLECRPFSHYWIIDPAPDGCSRAYIQIFAQGILNIVLDLMLLVLLYPLWTGRQFTLSQTLRIVALLVIGTFCMIVTGLKLAYVVGSNSEQAARSFWASIQILVSAFVANAPTIYGTFNLMRRRKQQQKLRRASRSDSLATLTQTQTPPTSIRSHASREQPDLESSDGVSFLHEHPAVRFTDYSARATS